MHNKSYKIELDPTIEQITLFNKAIGVARFTYNWGLAGCMESYKNGDKIFKPNAYYLHKLLNSKKKTEFIWMYEVSKCVPQYALWNVERAYKEFFNNKNKFPKFKKKGRVKSFKLESSVHCSKNKIHLPCIGMVKIKEHDYVPEKRFKSATISTRAGRWFLSVSQEELFEIEQNNSTEILGIDVGIKYLATLSSGETFNSSNKLKEKEHKLKKYERKFARQKGKNKQKTKIKIQKIYFDIVNQRKDILHKMTSFVVKTKRPKAIVIEDLNVKGMMKTHNLAKAIANVGFYEFKRQLEYKSKLYGVELVIADRWFPSSKMCSNCGGYKKDLKLSDRIYNCSCGLSIDRDMNAAYNLSKYYTNTVGSAEINACDKSVMEMSAFNGNMSEVHSALIEKVLTDKQEIVKAIEQEA